MDTHALERALGAAATRSEQIAAVARCFAAHALCYGHGTDSADDEAFWLVWQLARDAAADDDAADDDADLPLDATVAARIASLAARRVRERRPLAYLLGRAWFAGLEFEVDPSALIPRSPLAELAERGFMPWIGLNDGDRLLEIGTGSGCIAIASAVLNPGLTVDATEIDPAALALARRNIERHGVGDRVGLVEADLYPRGEARYRAIISNPPYVPTAEIAALPPEYGHEPRAALDGGEDGLDIVRRILAGAASRLTADGVLIVEVGLAADALVAASPRVPWTWIEFERGGEGVFVLTADELSDGWG